VTFLWRSPKYMLRTKRLVWLADTSPIHGANFVVLLVEIWAWRTQLNRAFNPKMMVAQLVKKLLTFYVNRILSIFFREVRHWLPFLELTIPVITSASSFFILLKTKYFSIQCSSISERALLFWDVSALRSFVLVVRGRCRWRWVLNIRGMMLTGEKPEYSEKTLYQCHCVHHKAHMD
jgi:hypothetical protein